MRGYYFLKQKFYRVYAKHMTLIMIIIEDIITLQLLTPLWESKIILISFYLFVNGSLFGVLDLQGEPYS